jgi:hypothetical protein
MTLDTARETPLEPRPALSKAPIGPSRAALLRQLLALDTAPPDEDRLPDRRTS